MDEDVTKDHEIESKDEVMPSRKEPEAMHSPETPDGHNFFVENARACKEFAIIFGCCLAAALAYRMSYSILTPWYPPQYILPYAWKTFGAILLGGALVSAFNVLPRKEVLRKTGWLVAINLAVLVGNSFPNLF